MVPMEIHVMYTHIYITCKCKFTQRKFIQVSRKFIQVSRAHGVLHTLVGFYPYPLSIICWFPKTTVNLGNIGSRDAEEVSSYFPLMSCTDTDSKKHWDDKGEGHTGAAEEELKKWRLHVYRQNC